MAIFELVKNAYDADATEVSVTITGLDGSEPTILIQDDGEGMAPATLRDVWLVPAHDHRERQRKNRQRTKKGRLPLGEKGLGRFAVHKLGDRIELVTRHAGHNECVVVIDWDNLMSRQFLSEAPVSVIVRPPKFFTGNATGTRIKITRLRDQAWSRGEARRLMRQITSISSPFDGPDGFVAQLRIPGYENWFAGMLSVSDIIALAPWKYTFKFDDGVLSWDYNFRGIQSLKVEAREVVEKSDRLQLPKSKVSDSALTEGRRVDSKAVADASFARDIGPVSGEFYVFDRDREILARMPETSLIKEFLDENGGVRVYRDGIRVYNYGEPGDDWLGLDLKRVNDPTRSISRNIVIGAIHLSLEHSEGLVEKTNREGFVENDAYRRLRNVVLGGFSGLVAERKKDKDKLRALTGKGQDPETRHIRLPIEKLRTAAQRVGALEALDPYIRKIEAEYEDMREVMVSAGLSGLGLSLVFHEVEQGVRALYDALRSGRDINRLMDQTKELVRILDGFSELLKRDERKRHSLAKMVQQMRTFNLVRFRHHRTRLVCPLLEGGADQVEAVFAFPLVLGALNNLIDNALHWLQVRWPDTPGRDETTPRAIYVGLSRDFADGPALVIADTGPGFRDDPADLTRPFFTRRTGGMGLGLYYANLVMEMMGGRLVFPERGDLDIPEEFDGAVVALVFKGEK
ncbi:MAG: ATP-binding protein [Niveispirillum sp.]|nr:ATP-binding protein [Niveispirillum sp.]